MSAITTNTNIIWQTRQMRHTAHGRRRFCRIVATKTIETFASITTTPINVQFVVILRCQVQHHFRLCVSITLRECPNVKLIRRIHGE